jgi:hypothetical protein
MVIFSRKRRHIFALLAVLVSPTLVWPGDTSWQGGVVGVSDGDTITVLHDGKGHSPDGGMLPPSVSLDERLK